MSKFQGQQFTVILYLHLNLYTYMYNLSFSNINISTICKSVKSIQHKKIIKYNNRIRFANVSRYNLL